MSLILDILIIIVAVIAVANGIRRGFIKSVMSLLSTLIAFVAAWIFTPLVSSFLADRFFRSPITGSVESTLRSLLIKNGDGYNVEKLFSDDVDAFSTLLTSFGADKAALAESYGGEVSAGADTVTKMAGTIADPVVSLVSDVVAFIVVFVLALILLFIISAIIEMFARLPVLKGANKILGFAFGLLSAAFITVLLCKFLPFAISALEPFNPAWFNDGVIDNTVIVKRLAVVDLLGMWGRIFP